MAEIDSLFVTRLYRAHLSEQAPALDAREFEASCYSIAEDDTAGQEWCAAQGYPGYTSYASLTDLPWRFPIFADLVQALDAHGGPVVVITGNGHARLDWGAPVYVMAAAPSVSIAALGQGEDDSAPSGMFDVVETASSVDRGDPCEAFR